MKFPTIALSAFLAVTLVTAEESGGSSPKKPAPEAGSSINSDELYSLGKSLFETYAPDSIKAEYDFVSPEGFTRLAGQVQSALETGSWADLVECIPTLRLALSAARATPQGAEWVDWLSERLDLAEAADEILHAPSPAPTRPPVDPVKPRPTPQPAPEVPHLTHWQKRLAGRPLPARAEGLMPTLKSIFAAEGIPPALVWLVEVESSFNPQARSPAGAKGLFQLMPATAQSLGLKTLLPDERTHPVKSAQAAAVLLRNLHARFSDWSLVLAAYNAGEGRVRRALVSRTGKTFAEAYPALPTETQLYVPKVLATVALREGIDPLRLPPPTPARPSRSG